MLAREKKRAAWSLAIGAFCASAIFGWEYRKALIAERRLPALVEQCKIALAPVTRGSGHAVLPSELDPPGTIPIPPGSTIDAVPVGCEPDALVYAAGGLRPGSGKYIVTPVQQQIADFALDAQNRYAWPRAIAAFSVFCLPLIWYFLLDRARELSAAISGRDRSP